MGDYSKGKRSQALNSANNMSNVPVGHMPPSEIWRQTDCNPKTGECKVPGPFLVTSGYKNPSAGRGSLKKALDCLK